MVEVDGGTLDDARRFFPTDSIEAAARERDRRWEADSEREPPMVRDLLPVVQRGELFGWSMEPRPLARLAASSSPAGSLMRHADKVPGYFQTDAQQLTTCCTHLEAVVSGPVVRRANGEHVYRCPLHDDRHASASMRQVNGRLVFNCFSCGGGKPYLDAMLDHMGFAVRERGEHGIAAPGWYVIDWDAYDRQKAARLPRRRRTHR